MGERGAGGPAPQLSRRIFVKKYILGTVKFHVVCLRVPLNLVTVDNFRIETYFCD